MIYRRLAVLVAVGAPEADDLFKLSKSPGIDYVTDLAHVSAAFACLVEPIARVRAAGDVEDWEKMDEGTKVLVPVLFDEPTS